MSSDEIDVDISKMQHGLLKKLENYGDSIVGSYRTKGKPKKNKKVSEGNVTKKSKKRSSREQLEEPKKKKKKKSNAVSKGPKVSSSKKLKITSQTDDDHEGLASDSDFNSNSDSELDSSVDEQSEKVKKCHKQMEELKFKLGLTKEDFAQYAKSHQTEKRESTAVITAAGKPRREPEVVVFEDPAKRRDRANNESKQMLRRKGERPTSEEDSAQHSFNMRDAKFDVYQFAVKGMAKEDRESAQIAHAIKLGAEPKKRAYTNYKVLMETKRKEKELQMERSDVERSMGYKVSSISSKTIVSSKANKRKGRKRPDNVLTKDGQIGRFREGIQFVSSKQLDKVGMKSGRR